MTGATLERPHVWQAGTGGPPLLLLHGTAQALKAAVLLAAMVPFVPAARMRC
jgi:hypothetical protein